MFCTVVGFFETPHEAQLMVSGFVGQGVSEQDIDLINPGERLNREMKGEFYGLPKDKSMIAVRTECEYSAHIHASLREHGAIETWERPEDTMSRGLEDEEVWQNRKEPSDQTLPHAGELWEDRRISTEPMNGPEVTASFKAEQNLQAFAAQSPGIDVMGI